MTAEFTQPAPAVPIEVGLAHQHAGRFDEAEAIYRQILAREPNHPDALHLLGLIGYHKGDYAASMELIMAALSHRTSEIFYGNLGNALAALGKRAAAMESYRQAIALKPDYVPAHNNLGNMLRDDGHFEEAVACFKSVIRLKPDYAEAYNNLANALVDLGRLDDAIRYYGEAVGLKPELVEARSNLLFILSYREDLTPAGYLEEARDFDRVAAARATPFSDWRVPLAPRRDGPLRVGLVSGDFKVHPTGHFLESILAHVDARRIQLVAYPTRGLEDELTARIKPLFAEWAPLAAMSDEAAARRIRDDRIDILVDLSGHMNFNRLPVFAYRPAPVQASWLGYFASTGMASIDYVLGDPHVLPAGTESQFVERLWRLPDSYLCFTPPAEDVAVGTSPALAQGHVTFGCFNHLMKMNANVVDVWARVLRAVPGSRLFLKAKQLDDAFAREATLARFAAQGIAATRLILEGRSPRAEYFAAYNRVDIALSPFPYPGGTTSVEGLWMGVPVLCLRGDRFLSNICSSMLHSAGLAEWIATSEDDYVAKAVAFAGDAAGLAALRGSLRARLLASPLCDAARFARNLESAFEGMWHERIGQSSASPAAVSPERKPFEAAPPAFVNGSSMQDIAGSLNAALAHHQAGRLGEAKVLYQRILDAQPRHADALHFMGLLACQIGKSEAGIALMRESIAVHPSPIYHNNLGNALRDAGELDAAVEAYRRAVALKQDYAEAHNNLGNALREAGDAASAVQSCAQALELRPGYAQAYNNLGNALKDLGELDAAVVSYGKAIAAWPEFAEAHLNLGHVLKAQSHADAALECYRTSVELAPQLAAAHDSLASMLMHRGDIAGAIESYRRVVALEPESASAHNTLGNVLNNAARMDEALPFYQRAIALQPDFADAYHNLANALRRLGAAEQALDYARRAIELRGDDTPSFHNNLGMILAELNQFDAAVECYRNALALNPDFGESHTCVLFGQSYCASWAPDTHLADARYFGERMTARAKPYTEWPVLADAGRRARPLRVGFVSADLRKHPVGIFLECALAELDRTRVEPIAYSNALHGDEVTARIKPRFAAWHHVAEMGDAALARKIHDDRIDILVDLSGHTGSNRLPMFAWRPAPLQVSWLGYFATTGLAEIDWLIADAHVVPESEAWHFVEPIWRLPDCYLCFTLPAEPAVVSPLPALTAGSVTFGCFNNQKKLNDAVVALWSRVLHAVPGSRLFLKNHQLDAQRMRRDTLARFASHGIGEDRLILEGFSSREHYFAAYHRVDLSLDPFPYPGGTTSVEGLWMGVPVVSRRGDRFIGHLGELVLRTVGLPEWIASDDDDYVAKAVAFASDLPRLAALRAGLRERVERSPLCDAPRLAGHLADAFEQMWAHRLAEHGERAQ
ncbi:MAG TPA: tetratricopeptide repeat protein [Trinickia sp.]|nr:tetratricopeptide repeat protein [Trinickia sp.]